MIGARDRLAGTVSTGPTWRVPAGPPLPGATAQASWPASRSHSTSDDHLALDPADGAQVVGADEGDLHRASRSLGHTGCSTCHCSGARRIMSSSTTARR